MDFDAWAGDVARRIGELADRRTFRFRATPRALAERYLAEQRRCEGMSEQEIETIEVTLGRRLPAAYRAFLRRLGKARGALFTGSDVEPTRLVQYRAEADALAGEDHLPKNAVVFIVHQGYTFCWFTDGDDPPITQFVEDEGNQPCAESFTAFVDAELAMMDDVNALARERGGTYLTITASGGTEVFPAGERPLDGDDELI